MLLCCVWHVVYCVCSVLVNGCGSKHVHVFVVYNAQQVFSGKLPHLATVLLAMAHALVSAFRVKYWQVRDTLFLQKSMRYHCVVACCAQCVAPTVCHVTTTLQNVLLAVALPTSASDRPIQVARVWNGIQS
jgi:hypothetical protein